MSRRRRESGEPPGSLGDAIGNLLMGLSEHPAGLDAVAAALANTIRPSTAPARKKRRRLTATTQEGADGGHRVAGPLAEEVTP